MHIETCFTCKMQFGMPDSFYETAVRMKEGLNFFCPAGHSQHYCTGESELDKMRRRAEKAEQDRAYWQDRKREEQEAREATERRLSATRGQVTKIKNRVSRGVCPCCNRSFANLRAHMATKHEGYAANDEAAA